MGEPNRLQDTHQLSRTNDELGLYTILPSPISYGVWHTKGGAVRGRILRNSGAIVLQ